MGVVTKYHVYQYWTFQFSYPKFFQSTTKEKWTFTTSKKENKIIVQHMKTSLDYVHFSCIQENKKQKKILHSTITWIRKLQISCKTYTIINLFNFYSPWLSLYLVIETTKAEIQGTEILCSSLTFGDNYSQFCVLSYFFSILSILILLINPFICTSKFWSSKLKI